MATTDTTQSATSPAEVAADAVDERLAERLVEQAKTQGTSLIGPDGLLHRVTKLVLETPWKASSPATWATSTATPPGATAATPPGGTRDKTVITEVGPVEISVPRDRDGTFEPVIVRKRQRRLGGVEGLVVSLTARA
ncbi:MAG TPA: transposase [Actinomycetes bacterium]|nr:transposase [Actinomycetes bacterium]